jgi:hypothetical protein
VFPAFLRIEVPETPAQRLTRGQAYSGLLLVPKLRLVSESWSFLSNIHK